MQKPNPDTLPNLTTAEGRAQRDAALLELFAAAQKAIQPDEQAHRFDRQANKARRGKGHDQQ